LDIFSVWSGITFRFDGNSKILVSNLNNEIKDILISKVFKDGWLFFYQLILAYLLYQKDSLMESD
jgi:hypothetical protein